MNMHFLIGECNFRYFLFCSKINLTVHTGYAQRALLVYRLEHPHILYKPV